MIAVLKDAVHSVRKNTTQATTREKRLYREVVDWLGDDHESPFSFEYICTVLGLDADYVRRGVLGRDWRDEIARHRRPAP